MQKGNISVQTENIFPIIKKFLYSDHEIFLRELVSNAVDASQKLKTLAQKGEFNAEIGDNSVEIILKKDEKQLIIKDKGIGMTEEEVMKYINQIAFSGAKEFVEKYEDENSIIGHFGLGFYSAFMVSDKVEIKTLSHKEDSQAVRWECDGTTEYIIENIDKSDRGTEIILHINEESLEFLEEARIQTLLEKYAKFLPIPIQFGEKTEYGKKGENGEADEPDVQVANVVNNPTPAWTKKPSELKDEDYINFYKELYPYSDAPLFWIHLNIDFPFELTGILYFPKLKPTVEVQRDKIQLYCNQVFVTDEVKEIVPEFLTLLQGVIDSPDIPLNVSRSYLQSDSNVKKISSYVTKKVGDKLAELIKNDRKDYEDKWEHINVFVKYGMITEEKFYTQGKKFLLLENTDKKLSTWEEFKERVEANQKNKDDKFIVLYANDVDSQATYIESAKKYGYEVLVLNTMIDNHFLQNFEQKENIQFVRVDSDTPDKLIEKDETTESVLSKKEQEKLESLYKEIITVQEATIALKALNPNDAPVIITRPEFSRRMKEMAQMGGSGMDFMANMPEQYNVVVNTNHPIASKLLGFKKAEKKSQFINHFYDLARLSQNMLKGTELNAFVERSANILLED